MKRTPAIAGMALLIATTIAGCGTVKTNTITNTAASVTNTTTTSQPSTQTHEVSDQEKAAEVAKELVAEITTFDYQNRASFDAPGKLMYADLAAQEDKIDNGLYSKYASLHAVGHHGTIKETFLTHNGPDFTFNVQTTFTAVDAQNNKQIQQQQLDLDITVQKTGSKFLVAAFKKKATSSN